MRTTADSSGGPLLPARSFARRPSLPLHDRPDGPEAARYRVLRARLRRLGDPQVIVVRGEHRRAGAEAVAVNLALAFAEGRHDEVALVGDRFATPALLRLLAAFGPRASARLAGERCPIPGWSRGEISERIDMLLPSGPSPLALDEVLALARPAYRHVLVAVPCGAPPSESDALLAIARRRGVGPRPAATLYLVRSAGAPGRPHDGDRPGASTTSSTVADARG